MHERIGGNTSHQNISPTTKGAELVSQFGIEACVWSLLHSHFRPIGSCNPYEGWYTSPEPTRSLTVYMRDDGDLGLYLLASPERDESHGLLEVTRLTTAPEGDQGYMLDSSLTLAGLIATRPTSSEPQSLRKLLGLDPLDDRVHSLVAELLPSVREFANNWAASLTEATEVSITSDNSPDVTLCWTLGGPARPSETLTMRWQSPAGMDESFGLRTPNGGGTQLGIYNSFLALFCEDKL